MPRLNINQIGIILLALIGWAVVYVFQEFDITRMEMRYGQYNQGHVPTGEEWRFIVNKGMRFVLNDLFSLLFIYGLFKNPKYVRFALWVMAFGLFVLLPTYLVLAISFKEEAFNLLTFLHRITMNPWLMLLLIPGFFYQSTLRNTGG